MCSTVGAAQKKDKTDRGLKAGDFLSDELTNAFKRRVPLWALNFAVIMPLQVSSLDYRQFSERTGLQFNQ